MSNSNELILKKLFWEAGNSWNLVRLYHDLADIKGHELTELELTCLRGLLLYGNRQRVAAEISIDPENLREILNSGLYIYISKLADTNNVTSRLIPQLLADRGYQIGKIKVLLLIKKFLPGAIATLTTGILINFLTNKLIQKTTTVPTPSQAPIISQSCKTFNKCIAPKGLFMYGGSTSWAPLRKLLQKRLSETQSSFKLQYQDPSDAKPSSGRGMEMLIDGEIDVALSSRPLTEKIFQEAKDRAITLREVKIARNAVAVIVHPSLKLQGLTMAQIQEIYRGNLKNWQKLGGPNMQIQPFIRLSTIEGITKSFLGDDAPEALGQNVQKVQNVTDGVRKVSTTPGSIFIGSASLMIKQCSIKVIPIGQESVQFVSPALGNKCPYELNREVIREGKYPHAYTTFLFIVYKENEVRSKEAGEALSALLLTAEGQQMIEESGFVRIQ